MIEVFRLGAMLVSSISLSSYAADCPSPRVPCQLKPLTSCGSLVKEGLPPGQLAVRSAPQELKRRLRANWETLFNPASAGWSTSSIDVLLALDEDQTEASKFVREAIHAYIRKAPLREGGLNILSNERLLPGPGAPPPAKRVLQESKALAPLHTSFTKKYDLEKYGVLALKVYAEILPAEYATKGFWSANWENHFSTNGVGDAYKAAHRLGLEPEQNLILTLMAIHQEFDKLGDASELRGDDEMIYNVGLYALSRFYFNSLSPYYYNMLWDAIELLKRVHTPAMRAKVSALFIDLAQDILSVEFQHRLIAVKRGDISEARSHMGVLLGNLLRGLKSSGTVEFVAWEDSVKVDYFSHSSDLGLRAAIRIVLKAKEELSSVSDDDTIDALMTTDDRDELLSRALAAERLSRPIAAHYFAALGMVQKAAAIYEETDFASLERAQLADILFRVGKEAEFLAALDLRHPVSEIRAAFKERAKRRLAAQDRMKRGNYVDSRFGYFLEERDRPTTDQCVAMADSLEQQRDQLNAGIWQLKAAFSRFLGDPGSVPDGGFLGGP